MRTALRSERGYSLIEMVTVLLILGIVMGGLTTLFVQGTNGELDMNRRFQAQENARVGLDRMRKELHCASAVTPAESQTASITLTLPTQCPTKGTATTIKWCVDQVPGGVAGRYGLYRDTSGGCAAATGKIWADYLTGATSIFYFHEQTAQSLGKLTVTLTVNTKPSISRENFTLGDDIVLRNSSRVCVPTSPTPPC